MTGLLISVRSALEAEIALAGGADLIDVKEPHHGSLGAAEPEVWKAVLKTVAGRAPVSVALGELSDELSNSRLEDLKSARGVSFAKMGLAGARAMSDWAVRWTRVMRELPAGVRPVAVVYADHLLAGSPTPEELLPVAARVGSPYLLLDTFDKSAGRLLDYFTIDELAALSKRAAQHQMRLVLAGSLDEDVIVRLASLKPAYFAVRGAACGGARIQAIERARVKRLATIVQTSVARASQEVA